MSEEKKKSKPEGQASSSTNKLVLFAIFIIGLVAGAILFYLQGPMNLSLEKEQAQNVQQDGMIASLITATDLDPQNALLWVQLGNAYYDTAQVKSAINAYTKALNINPNMPDVLIDYATMLRADALFNDSLSAYDKALKLSPNNPLALYNKGLLLYYDIKNKADAIHVWEELIKEYPQARTPDGRRIQALLVEMKKS